MPLPVPSMAFVAGAAARDSTLNLGRPMDAITSPPIQDTLPPPAPTSVPVTFTGMRSDFRRLVTHGAFLELVTVGFYRFWLTTNIRRHLWSHTEVEGDAPEYNGTGKELLIGFLFAVAVLAPFYVAYFVLGLEAEAVQQYASVPLISALYLFGQFAIYRARRYRVTRTVWRGVRFGMGGSGMSYMWRAALWTIFTSVTLGLALPWQQAALERFKMKHTSYGDLQGRFDGTGGQLFRRGWLIWLTAVLLLIGTIAASTAAAAVAVMMPAMVALPALVMLIAAIAAPFLYGRYKAIEWNWWVSGVRLGEVSFESTLAKGALTGLYWKVIGWSLLITLLLSAWIMAVVFGGAMLHGGFTTENLTQAGQQWSIMGMMAFGYVIAIFGFGVVMRLYLTHDVWARVAGTTTVHNVGAAQAMATHDGMAGAIGEGFADGLDVGGF
jgi:uncharacterized membrane protein YjgN (DUF898 family)